MATNEYDGDPIDASYHTAPWNENGETVEASDDDAPEHSMETAHWPENATPKEQLKEDQIAVIHEAALHRDINNAAKLKRMAVGERHAHNYAIDTLRRNWTERYNELTETSTFPDEPTTEQLRKMALDGYTATELAEKCDYSSPLIGKYLNGEKVKGDPETPPLEYNHSSRQWERAEPDTEPEPTAKTDMSEPSTPTDTTGGSGRTVAAILVGVYVLYRLVRRLI